MARLASTYSQLRNHAEGRLARIMRDLGEIAVDAARLERRTDGEVMLGDLLALNTVRTLTKLNLRKSILEAEADLLRKQVLDLAIRQRRTTEIFQATMDSAREHRETLELDDLRDQFSVTSLPQE